MGPDMLRRDVPPRQAGGVSGAPARAAEHVTAGLGVEGGSDGVWFLVDPVRGRVRSTFFHNGGGWWKGVDPGGTVRKFFIGTEQDEPHMEMARRLCE
ncbi:hypothetical protein ACFQ07_31765 [Actinomadura adrarensis]|uniref:Uncharacterized protein n=1 Tax=Actinomadura adrarensis TaxID=1819600 RepID=A0ABW3CR13_9ACTN